MSAVDLLQPVLDGGLQRNNFFNGRLLSAEDLRAEQDATRRQDGQLARAQGDGVAWGLSVAVLNAGPSRPRLSITAGLALNRSGDLLYLHDDTELTLVPEEKATTVAAGLFAECEPPRATATLTGEGAYVLVIAPSSGYSGTALVSDPNTTAIGRGSCGARFTVEGVRFRLVPIELAQLERSGSPLRARIVGLLSQTTVPARERLRNLLAHACFGTDEMPDYFTNPLQRDTDDRPVWRRWGVLDAMRKRNDITSCDVPLAVVVLTTTGIRFIDMWPARRRLLDAAAIDVWRGVAGPRRVAESEAAFLQFQSQLEIVKAIGTPANIAASTYFDALPAAGWLPIGSGGFNWTTFLGPHAPARTTEVDEALLRGIIERSWFDDPFRLDTPRPVPLHVYRVPNAQFVIFARSHNGNIRVRLTPAPTNAAVDVTATAHNGIVTKTSAHAAGTVTIPYLAPGTYAVHVNAPDFVEASVASVNVVGARTVDVDVALTPLPNGWIMVDARDKATGRDISGSVTRITAERGGTTFTGVKQSSGKFKIDNLPAGTYTVSGIASGYNPATAGGINVSRNTETTKNLVFEAPVVRDPKPSRCKGVTISKPPIGKADVCMVLEAMEFSEHYYYGDRYGLDGNEWMYRDEFRTQGRKTARKQSTQKTDVSPTDQILFHEPTWGDMVVIDPALAGRAWLNDWRDWFAKELGDKRLKTVSPEIYVNPKYQVPKTLGQIPARPQAYAVFGDFAVPLTIAPHDKKTRAPARLKETAKPRGVREEILIKYEKAGINDVNDLAFMWEEHLLDIGGELINPVRHQILFALEATDVINEKRTYLAGVDDDVKGKLDELGLQDDVALANANLKTLTEKLGNEMFAAGLIAQARGIVPRESWAIDSFMPSAGTLSGIGGIDSLGALAGALQTPEGKELVVTMLDLTGPTDVIDRQLTALELNAITTMTMHSIALQPERSIATLTNMDPATSMRFGEAGIVSADDLARSDAGELAAATNLPLATVEAAIAEARTASGGAISIGAVAGANLAIGTSGSAGIREASVGSIANMEAELAGEVGAGRAGAIVAGVNAGMAARMRGSFMR